MAQSGFVKPSPVRLCEPRANIRKSPRVPGGDTRLQSRHEKRPSAGAFAKPSDGLEPSGYWRASPDTRGHVLPANRPFSACLTRPRVPARAQSDVPVSYPRGVVCSSNRKRSLLGRDFSNSQRASRTDAALLLPISDREALEWSSERGGPRLLRTAGPTPRCSRRRLASALHHAGTFSGTRRGSRTRGRHRDRPSSS